MFLEATYNFLFKEINSSCGKVRRTRILMENPSRNSLKKKANEIINDALHLGVRLALIEAYPSVDDSPELPRISRHSRNDHLYKYEIILGSIHSEEITRIPIMECSDSPYVLNEKRIDVVAKEYIQDEIRLGYEMLGMTFLGEEPLHTEPVSEESMEKSRKSAKNDRPDYVWIKIKDGKTHNGTNWIPAIRVSENEVTSFAGLMFTDTPEEDTRSFTDCPIPGYVISVIK
jgi:hypothetical protein